MAGGLDGVAGTQTSVISVPPSLPQPRRREIRFGQVPSTSGEEHHLARGTHVPSRALLLLGA
ncbi:MAG: hypothetical protein AUI10_01730 [Actinobacteria bacterium 13_2_20CM_2_72_6]|nr:MAG: hypothetical protein AUI10_01730 [Actinobacteria bacterium 13_2_20CM_2_72_6]